jgi:5-bromo-4-chloroindolyl phosphate hydrolysis protein
MIEILFQAISYTLIMLSIFIILTTHDGNKKFNENTEKSIKNSMERMWLVDENINYIKEILKETDSTQKQRRNLRESCYNYEEQKIKKVGDNDDKHNS